MKILFVVLFFCVGTFAQENEETKIPYVNTEQAVKHLGVGLSADGETFYTYANNTLIHWNINPVKMIDAVEITDPLFKSPLNFDITPGKKKIIFSHFRRGIGLFDLSSKKFIKKIPMKFEADSIIGSNIVMVDKDRTITLRKIDDFTVTKEINIPMIDHDCIGCSDRAWALLKSKNEKNFALLTYSRIMIFDTHSLEQLKEKRVDFPINARGSDYDNYPYHQIIIEDNTIVDLDAPKSKLISNRETNTKLSKNIPWADVVGNTRYWYSQNTEHSNYYHPKNVFFKMKSKKLYQFMDGNWLIITDSGYFDGSPDSRKYLFMKTTSGETVPIANVSYQKFHRKIHLEKTTY